MDPILHSCHDYLCYRPYGPVIFAAPLMAPLAIFNAEWTYDPFALDNSELNCAGNAIMSAATET